MSDYPPHGRPRSWIGVGVIVTGFLVAGVALTLGPTWWLFWTGAAIVVVGGVVAVFSDVLTDVVLDEPRLLPESMHYSIFGRENEKEMRGGPHGERSGRPTSRDPADWPHG